MVLAEHAGMKSLAGFLMAALIFAAYNTTIIALYLASRTLQGLKSGLDFKSEPKVKRWIAYLGVTNGRRVPSVALVVSAVAFASCLPALHFARARPSEVELQEILSPIGTWGCVLIWAIQCLAFINYRRWIRRLRHSLEDDEYRKYNLWLEKNEKLKYRSLLEAPDFQPWVALAGLVVDLLLVFVISPAGWWREPVTPAGFFAAYAGPIALLLFFGARKITKSFWTDDNWGFVELQDDWHALKKVLDTLRERNIENSPESRRSASANAASETVPCAV